MNNQLIFIFLSLLIISCKGENEKKPATRKLKSIVHLYKPTTDSIQDEPTNNELEIQKKQVNHLFDTNGGSILYMKNGDIKGQARFDTDGDFVSELLKTETYGTYKDYENYVIQNGDTTFFFEEYGRIERDWSILKGIAIKHNLQVTTYSSPKPIINSETEKVTTSKLIIFSPETKKFADENSVEADNYFSAMDDWNFYSFKLKEYFQKLNIETLYTKKRYLLFEIENKESIILDTKSKINNYDAQCLL